MHRRASDVCELTRTRTTRANPPLLTHIAIEEALDEITTGHRRAVPRDRLTYMGL